MHPLVIYHLTIHGQVAHTVIHLGIEGTMLPRSARFIDVAIVMTLILGIVGSEALRLTQRSRVSETRHRLVCLGICVSPYRQLRGMIYSPQVRAASRLHCGGTGNTVPHSTSCLMLILLLGVLYIGIRASHRYRPQTQMWQHKVDCPPLRISVNLRIRSC